MNVSKQLFLSMIAMLSLSMYACEQLDDALVFPSISTEQYLYATTSTEKPANGMIIEKSVVTNIVHHRFDSGITRTKITTEPIDHDIIIRTTTEAWITKNPSYFTWSNGALVIGALVAIGIGAGVGYINYLENQKADSLTKKMLQSSAETLQKYNVMKDEQKRDIENLKKEKQEKINFLEQNLLKNRDGKSSDVNVSIINKLTDSTSLEELKKIVDEAEKLMLEDSKHDLTMHYINKAYFNIIQGSMDKAEVADAFKESAAYHEIGHAFAVLHNENSTRILHVVHNEIHGNIGGTTVPIVAYPQAQSTVEDENNEIKIDLSGIISQQIFSQPHPTSNRPDLYTGKMLTDKDQILEFLSEANAQGDMIDARAIAKNIIQSKKWLSYAEQQQVNREVDNMLVDAYKKTYEFLFLNKNKIQQGTNLLMEKRMISGDDLYNLWNAEKPLYDFEQGPLPQGLAYQYLLRGQ